MPCHQQQATRDDDHAYLCHVFVVIVVVLVLLLLLLTLSLFVYTVTPIVLPKFCGSCPVQACGIVAGTTSTMLLTLEFLGSGVAAVLLVFGWDGALRKELSGGLDNRIVL